MADDIRVPLGSIFDAFGVPATVTRPAPDDAPIETTGVWDPEEAMEVPGGGEFRRGESKRRERRYVMAFMRSEVPTLPRGSVVEAPEEAGGELLQWQVDAYVDGDSELHVAVLIQSRSETE